jgi:predicted nucleic acid-binding protein
MPTTLTTRRSIVVAKELVEMLWETRTGVLSTQVLQEFYKNLTEPPPDPNDRTKTIRPPVPLPDACELVRPYQVWHVETNTPESVVEASELQQRHGIKSFWDALIVLAALRAGASILYTEDQKILNHGVIEGLRLCNPFNEGTT